MEDTSSDSVTMYPMLLHPLQSAFKLTKQYSRIPHEKWYSELHQITNNVRETHKYNEVLLDIFQTHCSGPEDELVASLLHVTTQMALEGDKCQELLVKRGLGQFVLKALNGFAKHIGVQVWGLQTCRTLCRNNRNKVTLMHMDIMTPILRALREFREAAEVQEWAIRVVGNLTCNTANQLTIIDQGVVADIANAMDLYPTHGDIQQQGCGALSNLCCRANADRILNSPAIACVFRALQRFPQHPRIQEWGLGLVFRLAMSGRPLSEDIALSTLQLIKLALLYHPNDADVIKYSVIISTIFSSQNEEHQDWIFQHGLLHLFAGCLAPCDYIDTLVNALNPDRCRRAIFRSIPPHWQCPTLKQHAAAALLAHQPIHTLPLGQNTIPVDLEWYLQKDGKQCFHCGKIMFCGRKTTVLGTSSATLTREFFCSPSCARASVWQHSFGSSLPVHS